MDSQTAADNVANDTTQATQEQHAQQHNQNGSSSSSSSPNNTTATTSTSTISSLSLKELLYSMESFHAISKPVCLTMILSALAVVFINTEETRQATQEQLSRSYTVVDNQSDSNSKTLGLSLVNALVIVCVIAAMTFLIVLLYKCKCIKILIGYMMLSSTALLGFLGGHLVTVACNKYKLNLDVITFYLGMYNFAVVGTLCIFVPQICSRWTTQMYLILTSVILAWQLSSFDPWTSWTLLVMLALYDLCAVLTPCGPLKWLVKLMSSDNSPGMLPGLLYEARVGRGDDDDDDGADTTRNNNTNNTHREDDDYENAVHRTHHNGDASSLPQEEEQPVQHIRQTVLARRQSTGLTVEETSVATTVRSDSGSMYDSCETMLATQRQQQYLVQECVDDQGFPISSSPKSGGGAGIHHAMDNNGPRFPITCSSPEQPKRETVTSIHAVNGHGFPTTNTQSGIPSSFSPETRETKLLSPPQQCNSASPSSSLPQPRITNETQDSHSQTTAERPNTAMIPLAIAKLYRLPLVNDVQPTTQQPSSQVLQQQQQQQQDSDTSSGPNDVLGRLYSPGQLKSTVEAVFPRNGGRIDVEMPTSGNRGPTRYIVKDRHGIVKRRLVLDHEGRVFEFQEPPQDQEDRTTIKLGLGDFVFYSILVATAALYSFTTFCACLLVVLAGLGFTLVLLAVYHKALPALPISILLGVVFYLLTRACIEPYIHRVFQTPYYV